MADDYRPLSDAERKARNRGLAQDHDLLPSEFKDWLIRYVQLRSLIPATIASQSVQPGVQNIVASDATFSSGTVSISGFGNVTVNTQASMIRISAPVQSAQTGISAVIASDATYTSGTVQFTGSNAATVKSKVGQGVVIDVPLQTAQTGISSIVGSDATYTSGQVLFTGSNAVTVKSSAGQRVVIDAPTQTTQPGVQHLVASNATFSSGTVSISGFGEVTVNTAGSLIRISAPVQTAQTGISGVAGSNTTYTSGTLTITGVGGGITVSSNTGQRIDLSVAAPVAQTEQTQNKFNMSISNAIGGGTAGTMAHISSGTLTLYAGNNITLSQSDTNKLTIVGPTQATATGISGLGASNTTYTSGTVILSAQANITINTSVNGASQYHQFSVGAGGAGAARSYWHNMSEVTTQSQTLGNSTSYLQPFLVPYDISFSFLRFPASMRTSLPGTVSTRTGSWSASLLSTHNVAIYSRGSGASSQSLQSVLTGSAPFNQQWSFTAGAGASASQYTGSYRITHPITGGTSELSTTVATSLSNISLNSLLFTRFTSIRFFDIPLVGSLPAGDYWLMHGVSSTSSTVLSNVFSQMNLSHSYMMMPQITHIFGRMGETTHASIQQLPGIGSFTTVGGATTASLGYSNISSSASHCILNFGLHNSSGG